MKLIEELNNLSLKDDFKRNLGNVLTLRNFGNKLHGDNLEIAMVEWVNYYTNMSASHVGKDFFRSGENSDIIISEFPTLLSKYIESSKLIKNIKNYNTKSILECYYNMNIDLPKKENGRNESKKELSKFISNIIESDLVKVREKIQSLSLKCYGRGPLQLLTDPKSSLITLCKSMVSDLNVECYIDKSIINHITFQSFKDEKVLCVIYDESELKYSFILIDLDTLYSKVETIKYTPKTYKENGKVDKYEIFKFFDKDNQYIFEVRYGEGNANALQRGLWTKTNSTKNESFYYFLEDVGYLVDDEYLNNYKKAVSGLK